MISKKIFPTIILLILCLPTFSQHRAITIQDAEKQGISISHLDSIYKSAVHVDTLQAVFKTDAEQQAMYEAYVKLLQDFGKFLTTNNFKWEKPTKCFNRIYFSADGRIDYFLYNFLNNKLEDQLSQEKQAEFNRLLNLFIQNYKLALTATTKFAQCSPTTYMPRE